MRQLQTRTLFGLVALWLVFVLAAGPAFASPELGPDDHCTRGDAEATANAYYARGFRGDPNGEIFATDADLYCTFRSFLQPPEGICFDERDVFTGATVLSLDATDREVVRLLAEELEQIVFEFEVAVPAGAEWSVFETPVKQLGLLDGVFLVWRQFGFTFTKAVPGVYELHSEYLLFGEPLFVDNVTFTVLPHEIAHDLGRPVGGFRGSVACPQPLTS